MYCPLGNRYCANGPVCNSRRRSSSLTCRFILSASCFRIARCTRICPARGKRYGISASGRCCCCNWRAASWFTSTALMGVLSPIVLPKKPGSRTVAYTDESLVLALSKIPGTRVITIVMAARPIITAKIIFMMRLSCCKRRIMRCRNLHFTWARFHSRKQDARDLRDLAGEPFDPKIFDSRQPVAGQVTSINQRPRRFTKR